MKWKKEKINLEKLIEEKKSYEEIGRLYGCSGANIKKVYIRLGIKLEPRRKINPKETFRRGTAKNNKRDNLRCICPNCDSQLDTYKSKNKHSDRKFRYKK